MLDGSSSLAAAAGMASASRFFSASDDTIDADRAGGFESGDDESTDPFACAASAERDATAGRGVTLVLGLGRGLASPRAAAAPCRPSQETRRCGRLLRRPPSNGMAARVNDQRYPVSVLVKRPDGSTESVRVGTAVRAGDGFRLTLGELSIGAPEAAPARAARPAVGGDQGMVFPPYGRSKGMPIAGASVQDLEFYIGGCRRTLDDPNKARWHEKERVLLAALEAELARQRGGDAGGGGGDEPSWQGSSRGASDYEDAPPPSDEDIPF